MKRLPLTAVAAALTLLGGCGVGIGVEISDDDDPPSVNLSSDMASAQPGHVVRLAAAASDDGYVEEVRFYRIEPNGSSTLLCTDRSPGYDCNALIPADAAAGSRINFYARAWDNWGQSTDSAAVAVTVL
jgi:hypothetical protein